MTTKSDDLTITDLFRAAFGLLIIAVTCIFQVLFALAGLAIATAGTIVLLDMIGVVNIQ